MPSSGASRREGKPYKCGKMFSLYKRAPGARSIYTVLRFVLYIFLARITEISGCPVVNSCPLLSMRICNYFDESHTPRGSEKEGLCMCV